MNNEMGGLKVTADEIKWMCGYADGFEYHEEIPSRFPPEVHWFCGYKDWIQKCGLIGFEYSPLFPLLLQRAIEGVNRKMPYWVSNYPCYYAVVDTITVEETDYEYKLDDPDAAKLAALRYIMKEEQK